MKIVQKILIVIIVFLVPLYASLFALARTTNAPITLYYGWIQGEPGHWVYDTSQYFNRNIYPYPFTEIKHGSRPCIGNICSHVMPKIESYNPTAIILNKSYELLPYVIPGLSLMLAGVFIYNSRKERHKN